MKNKKYKCPYKPPRPPRCLCRTFVDWLFGIVSPSLLYMHIYCGSKEGRDYIAKCANYKFNVLQWKEQKRIITKAEYKKLDGERRRRKNEKQNNCGRL